MTKLNTYANMFNMNAKEKILLHLKESDKPLSALEISQFEDMPSRTYTAELLSQLVSEGEVERIRIGKNIYYRVSYIIYEDTLTVKGLKEDEVWDLIRKKPGFIASLSEQTETSLHFAFTEMLNNVIDHSKSGTVYILLELINDNVQFTIRDHGIGAFNSLMSKKKYDDTLTAIQELVKGKNTSDPVHHSGEGIFWTSKIADKFVLKSSEYELVVDNIIQDYAIGELGEVMVGTEVFFQIEKQSKKSISSLFHLFSFDEEKLTLDTTTIPIKLYNLGDVWISRSQAKKVLLGLEKYKKIIFDFRGVEIIGQGFADEIFRVFQNAHPDIVLEPVNMTDTVAILVNDARSG